MNEIIEESLTGAYLIDNVDSISYIDRKSERGVQLAFEGFNSAMMWTKSAKSGMFCIEPVTQLPDKKRNYLDDVTHETLASSERKQYLVHIIPI